MRKSYEIYETVLANNKKSLSCRELAVRCIRIAMEEAISECAKRAKITTKNLLHTTIDKKVFLSLINEVE